MRFFNLTPVVSYVLAYGPNGVYDLIECNAVIAAGIVGTRGNVVWAESLLTSVYSYLTEFDANGTLLP